MNGEVCENCQPLLVALQDRNAGLEYTVRAQAARIGKLTREEENVREHDQWERAARLFKVWQRATGHTRSRWTIKRFRECLHFLETYEDELILRAIEGIASDPNTDRRKNGHLEKYDDWGTLFKNDGAFERYCNRAPEEWRDNLLDHAKEIEGLAI